MRIIDANKFRRFVHEQLEMFETYSADEILEMIDEQPTVKSKPKWIPASERLPERENECNFVSCNVTVMRSHYPTSTYDYCDSPYDEYLVMNAMYDVSQKIWHIGDVMQLNALLDIEDLPLNGDYVIAWQPLPAPYKEERGGKNE